MNYNAFRTIIAILYRFLFRMRTMFFFAAVSVCCAAFILALFLSNCQFRKGQEVIIANQREQIARWDSITKHYEQDLVATIEEKEKTVSKMLTDSSIRNTPGLCPQQKDAVINFIKPCWEETTREYSRAEKIKGMLNTAPSSNGQLLQDVKSLLELQFNKIQNEYETLEIWTALLTIVFLIFSFYSLFKSERFEEQSRMTTREISQLRNRAENRIDELLKSGQQHVKKAQLESEQAIIAMRERIDQVSKSYENELNSQLESRITSKEQELDSQSQRLETLINDAESLLSKLEEQLIVRKGKRK